MEDPIKIRQVKISGKGDNPSEYQVVDVGTGEILQGVRGINIAIGVDDRPKVTIEQYHYNGPELDIQAKATIKNKDQSFKDSAGRIWLNAAYLVQRIRETGTLCEHGKKTAVSCDFTEGLLREWEGKKPAPAEGHKETSSHG